MSTGNPKILNKNFTQTKINNGEKPKQKINHNINNSNKDSELSTKISGKDNFLDYTFISHRSQICSQKTKDSTKSKDYIFDLINTWEINNVLNIHIYSIAF